MSLPFRLKETEVLAIKQLARRIFCGVFDRREFVGEISFKIRGLYTCFWGYVTIFKLNCGWSILLALTLRVDKLQVVSCVANKTANRVYRDRFSSVSVSGYKFICCAVTVLWKVLMTPQGYSTFSALLLKANTGGGPSRLQRQSSAAALLRLKALPSLRTDRHNLTSSFRTYRCRPTERERDFPVDLQL